MSGVRLEREGSLARIIMDRPPLNVLDIRTLETFADLLDAVAGDSAIKVLTVAGTGKAFCAGLDVADHAEDKVERMLEIFHDVICQLRSLPMPVIAVVHGAALGGGCEIAMACDLVLARSDATLGQPEIRLGVFPPVAAALLPRRIGRQNALDLVLTGRVIGADEAQRLGLVTHAWPADDFAPRVAAYVETLQQLSGPTLRVAKHAIAAWLDVPFVAALQNAERLYLDELMKLEDAREGIAAFLQKRPPVWKEN